MADPQVLNTLHAKRQDIEGYIADLERRIEEARSDLAHVLATIRLFAGEDGERVTAYMNLTRLFPRNELPRLAREALEAAPDGIDTRAIALHVIEAKGLDASDRHLRKAVAYKIVQVLRRQERRGEVCRSGQMKGALIWRTASQ
jgi:hypothetical protein